MLKNRATDKVLFVVLFTLYLKEDIDEQGNLKEGVDKKTGVPFSLLGEGEERRHGDLTKGEDDDAGDGKTGVEKTEVEDKSGEKEGKGTEKKEFYDTQDDGVD